MSCRSLIYLGERDILSFWIVQKVLSDLLRATFSLIDMCVVLVFFTSMTRTCQLFMIFVIYILLVKRHLVKPEIILFGAFDQIDLKETFIAHQHLRLSEFDRFSREYSPLHI